MITETLTDQRATGFTAVAVDAERYSACDTNPLESQGKAIAAIPAGSRVLDVGCGSGDFGAVIRNALHCDVIGIEPHPERAALARSNGLDVITGFLTTDIIRSVPPFDRILFLDVLEHTADPVELLSVAVSALKPGGRVIISVPNVAHWTVRLRLLAGRFDYRPTGIMDATHLRWFTRKTIASVIKAAGLKIVQQDVSRGTWMRCYRETPPTTWLRASRRIRVIDRLCKTWPGLFGAQHFVVAEL